MISPGLFRLFLALVVVLHHSTPLRLGGWAVGLFFALSGFWIAEMWQRKYRLLDRPYVEFIASRWWRVAPTLLVVTAVAALIFKTHWLPGDLSAMHHDGWWLTQPLIAGSTHFGRVLPPAWSLDVEMQFYLIAPFLILAALRLSRIQGAMLTASLVAWGAIEAARGNAGEHPRLDVWLGVFAVGMLTSIIQWRVKPSLMLASFFATLLALVVIAVIPSTRPWIIFRGSSNTPALSGSVSGLLTLGVVLLSLPFTMATTAIRSGWTDRFLGDLSYPLYLIHWVPRQWYYAQAPLQQGTVRAVELLCVNVAAAVTVAIIILLLIDRPIQHIRTRWVRNHVRSVHRTTLFPIESVEPTSVLADTVQPFQPRELAKRLLSRVFRRRSAETCRPDYLKRETADLRDK